MPLSCTTLSMTANHSKHWTSINQGKQNQILLKITTDHKKKNSKTNCFEEKKNCFKKKEFIAIRDLNV